MSSSHYTSGRVTHHAFLPNPKDGLLSAFEVEGLSGATIHAIGMDHVLIAHRRQHGYAALIIEVVLKLSLTVRRDEPPPRHVSVGRWPDTKDARKLVALELASAAKLVLFSDQVI